jgi:fucose 4-O-acetylase-like acetyltransferase
MEKSVKHYYGEIDYAKGILITLMVMFHLGQFNTHYPEMKACVYSFHMSGFLLLSGYLFSYKKEIGAFCCHIRGLLVPYIIFELLYLIGLGYLGKYLGASNVFDGNIAELIHCVLSKPSGTYWYLHTLIICSVVYYLTSSIHKISDVGALITAGIVQFLISMVVEGLHWENVMYFMIGATIRRMQINLPNSILASWYCLFGIVAIIFFTEEYDRFSISGIGLTFMVVGFLFWMYKCMPNNIMSKVVCYVGKNSLAIVLFSPILTIITKSYVPLFKFDDTAILWMLVSVMIVHSLSFISIKLADVSHISKVMTGKKLYRNYDGGEYVEQ